MIIVNSRSPQLGTTIHTPLESPYLIGLVCMLLSSFMEDSTSERSMLVNIAPNQPEAQVEIASKAIGYV